MNNVDPKISQAYAREVRRREIGRKGCDDCEPDENIDCAVEDCEYFTEHTATDHCHHHTWRLGREADTTEKELVTDGGRDTAAMQQDGALIIGARCTDDDCEWQPAGTDDPHHWDIVERLRLSHEDETGHQVTVETVEQRTILAEKMSLMDATLQIAEDQGIAIEWICPECEKTGEELGTVNQCPDCGEYLREVLP